MYAVLVLWYSALLESLNNGNMETEDLSLHDYVRVRRTVIGQSPFFPLYYDTTIPLYHYPLCH
jgi:hypothetical protein